MFPSGKIPNRHRHTTNEVTEQHQGRRHGLSEVLSSNICVHAGQMMMIEAFSEEYA